jgi:cell division protein FtsB
VIALRRPGAFMIALLFLLIGAAFLTQVVPYRQMIDTHRRVDAARAELAQLESENAKLQDDVKALKTDTEIEKLAREKLGYVYPGEKAFVVLDPPEADTQVDEAEPAPAVPEKTWVDRLLDFITGNDLAD